ncbi:hypothetical protein [Sandaracinus amylolyticus]|uniref:hypothetical protein n=1 Tax=Sandaracinus amylolyticus TaxID=927083 RepID=UPI001F372DE7|nr:hypothetical protein [Sandaracinus amylolyticus]UJR82494.1 Hypothetical protein I5071_45590 [Sandaracinus amylolyticus]
MARGGGALGAAGMVVVAILATMLAPRSGHAQTAPASRGVTERVPARPAATIAPPTARAAPRPVETAPPPVEPPDAGALHELCAQGSDALWRGHVAEAEMLARQALRAIATTTSSTGRHARARCEALLGRAILARGSRDPRVHAEAAGALRRAWSLEPSADLVDDLVASHWLGSEPALPTLDRSSRSDAPAERAAARVVSGEARRVTTLRSVRVAGGTTWSLVLAQGARSAQIVAVGCRALGACSAEVLADTSRESVRVATFGFVPSRGGVALVVELDRAWARGGVAWEGTTLHLRWWRTSGLDGWSLLTRSRARVWCREVGRRPESIDVRARFARGRVAFRPIGDASIEAMARWTGFRDPASIACERCWLAGLVAPEPPITACGGEGG